MQNSVPIFSEIPTSSVKQPLSLQIANSMESIIENNILQLSGNVRG
jgi:hypothetical protein